MSKLIVMRVCLKTGEKFDVKFDEETAWNPSDLTDKTIHKLVCSNGDVVILSGGNISYLRRSGNE